MMVKVTVCRCDGTDDHAQRATLREPTRPVVQVCVTCTACFTELYDKTIGFCGF